MNGIKRIPHAGFTIIEIIIALFIVVMLTGFFLYGIIGMRSSDKVDRGAQLVYNDIIYIRSRAISTNLTYRINFTSTTDWQVQVYDDGTATWNLDKSNSMPADAWLTADALTNAADNLEATPNGLFVFQDSMVGEPYITVGATGESKTKAIEIFVGGAVSLEN
jgi:Tfp pilus assembly protein FimT